MLSRKVFQQFAAIKDALDSYRIVDVRYSLDEPATYGTRNYKLGHIPRARFANLDEELCGPLTSTSGRHPLPDPEQFIQWCTRNSIGDKPVLCYDDQGGGMAACRLWWMLDSLGVESYVLEGGWQEYLASGLPSEEGEAHPVDCLPSWEHRRSFESRAVTLAGIPVGTPLVDARFAIRYNTTVRPYGLDTCPGHLPNAVNLPWNLHLLEPSKRLKPLDELTKKMQDTLGGKLDATSHIFMCASGVTACMNVALATHLGFGTPKLYGGSWSQFEQNHSWMLRSLALQQHGMFFTMRSKSLAMNPKFNPEIATITVDGQPLQPPFSTEVQSALTFLHVGESARIDFKNGLSHEVTVQKKTA